MGNIDALGKWETVYINGWPVEIKFISRSSISKYLWLRRALYKTQATTVTLAAIIFCQIAAVLNIRYARQSMFNKYFFKNSMIFIGIIMEIVLLLCISYVPVFQSFFGTEPLNAHDWMMLVCIPLPLILIDELRKWILRKESKNK